ncbi:hypothetical protein EDD36DRAFT_133594 [Exophiala viscosa]|uniref:Uncharacterized protein n=1 Tax=Exophiala viscosa TaxID=2486360 RepID=A0AAN6E3D0_9EURO|nr:hypothetical protein EDD36DRAFT_133594 [Exophiala viscosa]
MKIPGGRAVTTSSPDSSSPEFTLKPRKPTFLSLPAEIRLRIYEYHLSSPIGIIVKYRARERYQCDRCYPIDHWGLDPFDSYWDWKQGQHRSNLLRGCKQIAAEARPVAQNVCPAFSFAFPYVGRHNLPKLPYSLARKVRTVEINSRGIPPFFRAFTSALKPGVYVYRVEPRGPCLHYIYDRGLEHVQEVMIHSHTSLPIKVRALGQEIRKLCQREATVNAHQELLQRCFHQAKVALFPKTEAPTSLHGCDGEQEYDEDLFQVFKKKLGHRVVKIRCSFYEPEFEENRSVPESQDDTWVCQVSGLLVLGRIGVRLANLRTHRRVEKKERDMFKNVMMSKEECKWRYSPPCDPDDQGREQRAKLGAWYVLQREDELNGIDNGCSCCGEYFYNDCTTDDPKHLCRCSTIFRSSHF